MVDRYRPGAPGKMPAEVLRELQRIAEVLERIDQRLDALENP